jgi:hypothetical protein
MRKLEEVHAKMEEGGSSPQPSSSPRSKVFFEFTLNWFPSNFIQFLNFLCRMEKIVSLEGSVSQFLKICLVPRAHYHPHLDWCKMKRYITVNFYLVTITDQSNII